MEPRSPRGALGFGLRLIELQHIRAGSIGSALLLQLRPLAAKRHPKTRLVETENVRAQGLHDVLTSDPSNPTQSQQKGPDLPRLR